MTDCAGAFIRQSNRNVNKKYKNVISSKKKENYHGDHKILLYNMHTLISNNTSILEIYNSCK